MKTFLNVWVTFYLHYYSFSCTSILLISIWEQNCRNTSGKKLFLQYLWSDLEKQIPEISCENIVLMRFLTNFTDQHNLNSLNLFPVSKPFEICILPQMPCYIVQKLQVTKGVCSILQELWVSKEVVKPGMLSKLSYLSVILFLSFFYLKQLHIYLCIFIYMHMYRCITL